MSIRDVNLRYAQVEADYLEMKDLLKELKDDVASGRIPVDYYEEKLELINDEVEKVSLQYFFWAEALFELRKPNRKSKKMNDTELSYYNNLKTITKEVLKDDSQDPLKYLKQMLKEGKLNDR